MIRLVVFDLDDTLWKVFDGYCSLLRDPMRMVKEGVLEDSLGRRVKLIDGAEDTLSRLREMGVLLSVASRSDERPTLDVMERLGILGYFVLPQIGLERKISLVRRLLRRMKDANDIRIPIEEVLFVDDWEENMAALRENGCHTLVIGKDIHRLDEVVDFVRKVNES